jgi:hypothetical protein
MTASATTPPRTVWHVEHWETIAVTALPPGWRNVFDFDDGTMIESPCPAVLLQELRSTSRCEDVPQPDGTLSVQSDRQRHEPPYEMRVVFATFDAGVLHPVDELDNYLDTLAPTEPGAAP